MSKENPLEEWRTAIVDGFTFYRRPVLRRGRSDEGNAEPRHPVLLLNGCALAAGSWTPVIDGLANHDVLAIDRPGFADTQWAGGLPDLASEVAVVQRAIAEAQATSLRLTALNADPVILVAHSMASFRAEALARLRPDMVAGLVLVDPSVEGYRRRGIANRFFTGSWLHSLDTFLSAEEVRAFMAHMSHRGMLRQVNSVDGLDLGVFKDQYANIETLKAACAEWLSYRIQAAELTALRARTVPVRTPTSALFASALPNRGRLSILDRGFSSLGVSQVEGTRHLMMIDRPDAIIRAVEECCE